jgi:hypothetical protein
LRKNLVPQFRARSVVAFAAALAVALSTIVASLIAARAAADAVVDPFNLICHSASSEAPSPSHDEGKGGPRIDCCNAGCALVLGTPPLRLLLRVVRVPSPAALPTAASLPTSRQPSTWHRSRAPPRDV